VIKYTRSGDSHIAYRIDGEGPRDILYLGEMLISIEAFDDEPHVARFNRRLSAIGRLILFDGRGLGLSDREGAPFTPEGCIADALAALDAAGSTSVVVVAAGGGGPIALQLAADHPDRVAALVLVNSYARLIRDDDTPFGLPEELVTRFVEDNPDPDIDWSPGGVDDAALLSPSLRNDARYREWFQRSGQRAAGPGTARRWLRMTSYADARRYLPAISVPTLVLSRTGDRFVPAGCSRYLADHIQGAAFVELPGKDHSPHSGDSDALADEIEEFISGSRHGSADRALVTLLFTDIVDSTSAAAGMGDTAWRAQLDGHDAAVRTQIGRFGGREVNTTGDGFLASFESPTQAVRCAHAIVATGLPVRIGIHTGECERRGSDLAGVAVHIAARVAAAADAGEVMVSRTVCDLVSGSGMRFDSRGLHALKGVETEWELFVSAP
jgi:class 3 adenylate cyclase